MGPAKQYFWLRPDWDIPGQRPAVVLPNVAVASPTSPTESRTAPLRLRRNRRRSRACVQAGTSTIRHFGSPANCR